MPKLWRLLLLAELQIVYRRDVYWVTDIGQKLGSWSDVECQNGVRLWTSFQNAASAVTTLYKECVELQKRQQELAVQFGVHRRNK
ncbi:UPF0472 protein C16orf72-like, partial [Tropilaelaps mercedesae]